AVDGLAEARLIGSGGEVLETRELSGQRAELTFTIPADSRGWVALEVEDSDGDVAWSNPLWLARLQQSELLMSEN
ncbi:MAG TPA: hypothetical protein VFM75_00870, partial [Modicisalibacter sp.]|nr:hypothetical protein [Modicisalibacter sp.]